MSAGTFSATVRNIREDLYYHVFLLFLLAFVVYHYWLTLDANNLETVLLPRFVLILMGALIVIEFMIPFIAPVLRRHGILPPREALEESDEEDPGAVTLENTRPVMRDAAMVIVYLLALYVVGMFTSTFVFSFLYIYMNMDEGSMYERGKTAFVWSLGFVVAMYLMFVEILGSLSLLSFGFLP